MDFGVRVCSIRAHTSCLRLPAQPFMRMALPMEINSGLLDHANYKPVVQKAWQGLLSNIYQDGRLGCIQPVGAAPGAYTAASSYVFGSGRFCSRARNSTAWLVDWLTTG